MVQITQFQATAIAVCTALGIVIPIATLTILRAIKSLKEIIAAWRDAVNGSLDKRIETIVKATLHENSVTASPVVVNVVPGDSSVSKQTT